MAKRKSKKTKRKSSKSAAERSNFWPLAGAIVMGLIALLLFIGGFGIGGPLPEGMFDGAYWAVGWAAYLTPLLFGYYAYHKFMSEDYRIPLEKFVSMLALVAFASIWFEVAFATKDAFGEFADGNGGMFGGGVGGAILTALDKIPASIVFFVLSMLAFFFAFAISPRVVLRLGSVFGSKKEDTDLSNISQKSTGFKLNEGVPTESSDDVAQPAPKHASLKNTAQKLTAQENHEALTTANDPDWQFPSLNLLEKKQDRADAGDVEGNAEIIKDTFANFKIDVDMEGANIGPRVTQYTLKPPSGTKLSKITALENNLALDLAATSIRMEAPIPGKRAVGIEVPNIKSATVRISSLLGSTEWGKTKSPLPIVIGRDIAGTPVVGDLDKMPHLLVAGQTGSGKSVMVNTLLTSLLYRNSPSQLKLILVDPKQVEMKPYEDIPHLLTPVITEPEKCISALKWAVAEMERRYKELADKKKRNIGEYNAINPESTMPYIVIVIDELADLMMMAARDVEALIVRIAQKARAVGIHLVLATQRPSVDVITGLIKANVPARVAFTTTSQVDSRTIIDQIGAEKLLGMGDMLFSTSSMPKPIRVQGAFISDDETLKVVDFIKDQRQPEYDDEVVSQPVQLDGKGGVVADYGGGDADDDMFRDAVQVVIEGRKASTSLLQRRLRIGYARAARIIETMEEQGIIGAADGSRPRDVLVNSLDEVFGGPAAPEGEDVYDDMPDE